MDLERTRRPGSTHCWIWTLVLLMGCSSEESSPSPTIVTMAKTDAEGQVRFTDAQSGNQVALSVKDPERNPLSDVEVIYFDGDFFGGFGLYHANYEPKLEIAKPKNVHDYSFSADPMQAVYYETIHADRNELAARSLFAWAIGGWEYLGCQVKESIAGKMAGGIWLIQKDDLLSSLGVSDTYVDQAVDQVQQQMDSASAVQIWRFNPSAHGVSAPVSFWVIDLRTKVLEIGGNSLDDNCDGQIDENDG